jgi:hypothetical protein
VNLNVLSALQYLAKNAASTPVVSHFKSVLGQHSQELLLRYSNAVQVAAAVVGQVAVTIYFWGQVEGKAVKMKAFVVASQYLLLKDASHSMPNAGQHWQLSLRISKLAQFVVH